MTLMRLISFCDNATRSCSIPEYYQKTCLPRGERVDRRFGEATIFSDCLWGDIITEQRQLSPASFDIPPAMGYKHRETALP